MRASRAILVAISLLGCTHRGSGSVDQAAPPDTGDTDGVDTDCVDSDCSPDPRATLFLPFESPLAAGGPTFAPTIIEPYVQDRFQPERDRLWLFFRIKQDKTTGTFEAMNIPAPWTGKLLGVTQLNEGDDLAARFTFQVDGHPRVVGPLIVVYTAWLARDCEGTSGAPCDGVWSDFVDSANQVVAPGASESVHAWLRAAMANPTVQPAPLAVDGGWSLFNSQRAADVRQVPPLGVQLETLTVTGAGVAAVCPQSLADRASAEFARLDDTTVLSPYVEGRDQYFTGRKWHSSPLSCVDSWDLCSDPSVACDGWSPRVDTADSDGADSGNRGGTGLPGDSGPSHTGGAAP